MTAALTVLLIVAIAAFLAALVWAFRHDHEHGHCGWSGCQAPTRRTP